MKTLSHSWRLAAALAALAWSSVPVRADVHPARVFSDNMVLQRELPVWVWGSADAGEKVTVTFGKESGETTADAQGRWKVKLAPAEASEQGQILHIQGNNAVDFKNVLVGEVWLASGQSNMEYPMKRWPTSQPATRPGELDPNAEALKLPEQPTIRLLVCKRNDRGTEILTDGWQVCDAKSLAPFSAVAYFFGKELSDKLHMPIGLIDSTWGGTRIEPWTDPAAYSKIARYEKAAATQPVVIDRAVAGKLYAGMIKPLMPYSIRGVIWYQGESNVSAHDGLKYADKMKALVNGWRSAWGEGEFPFYYVQLAPYIYNKNDPLDPSLPEVWEAQNASQHLGKAGMAATSDLVIDLSNIHPTNKADVGHRLALLALSHDYGQKDLVYSGPTFDRFDVQGGDVVVSFSNIGSGLTTRDGKTPNLFEIAGQDKKYYPAEAKIDGVNVTLTSKDVPAPLNARFAWRQDVQPNLENKEGLPALPFETSGPQADAY